MTAAGVALWLTAVAVCATACWWAWTEGLWLLVAAQAACLVALMWEVRA